VVTPRPAATVILLRDGADGIEAWLMRRVAQMAFAPKMSVFPGGRVDDADYLLGSGQLGSSQVAGFDVTPELARAALVAAVRETFEETGVLLTTPPAPVGDLEGWAQRRHAVEKHELSFAELLAQTGLAVDGSLIRAWGRWVTPDGEPRRYDTFFFVAALPDGAVARAETTEAIEADWIRPADALAQYDAGERPTMAPTRFMLAGLTEFPDVATALASSSARSLAAVRPELNLTERSVTMPDGSVFDL
jgi:8-oxo-dGTP pyrophosphatase MutT (NUDIX family)